MVPLLLGPLQIVLGRMARGVAERQPALFERLGRHCSTTFLIDPVDLPVVLLLKPVAGAPELRAAWRSGATRGDCRIAGRFTTLLALVDGRRDGDATFFSRDLTVEGDIDAVVTLRNALDDLDQTLVQDILGAAGPLRRPLTGIMNLFRAADRAEARHAG